METMEQALAQFRNECNELSAQERQWLPQGVEEKVPDGRCIMRVGNGEFTLTTYEGAPATPQEIANETAPLAAAFPQIQDAFMAVLAERIISEQWPAERVRDAVNYTIATAKYPTFQMAQFLSFDRPVKLYNHYGYQRLREEGYTDYGGCQGDSEIGKTEPINGHVYFYLKKDLPNFLIGKKIF